MAVTRPSEQKMSYVSNHLQFRSTCIKNLEQQLFQESTKKDEFSHKPTSKDKISDGNIRAMTSVIQSHGMYICTTRGLVELSYRD